MASISALDRKREIEADLQHDLQMLEDQMIRNQIEIYDDTGLTKHGGLSFKCFSSEYLHKKFFKKINSADMKIGSLIYCTHDLSKKSFLRQIKKDAKIFPRKIGIINVLDLGGSETNPGIINPKMLDYALLSYPHWNIISFVYMRDVDLARILMFATNAKEIWFWDWSLVLNQKNLETLLTQESSVTNPTLPRIRFQDSVENLGAFEQIMNGHKLYVEVLLASGLTENLKVLQYYIELKFLEQYYLDKYLSYPTSLFSDLISIQIENTAMHGEILHFDILFPEGQKEQSD